MQGFIRPTLLLSHSRYMKPNASNMPTTPPSPTISAEELAFSAYQISVQHQTRQPNLYAAVSVCLLIAYISVALRLLARNRMGQPLMADDFWIIGALVCHWRCRSRSEYEMRRSMRHWQVLYTTLHAKAPLDVLFQRHCCLSSCDFDASSYRPCGLQI
jgi:hypothetical protein